MHACSVCVYVKRKKQTAFTVASGPAQNNFPQIAVEIFLIGALSRRVLVFVSRRPLTLMFRSLANCQTVGVTFTSNSLAWMWFRMKKSVGEHFCMLSRVGRRHTLRISLHSGAQTLSTNLSSIISRPSLRNGTFLMIASQKNFFVPFLTWNSIGLSLPKSTTNCKTGTPKVAAHATGRESSPCCCNWVC